MEMIENHAVENKANLTTPFAVEVVKVSKRFGANIAASDINLAIQEGEFFSFLGPSGCGKTTLLRMIAGFENPSEGAILISGENMVAVPPHKRSVNMVFQNYALFPHLSIGENVAFGLKSKKRFSNSEIAKRVKDSLDLVRLSQLIDRFPNQLSGGQQQRVALARALANEPKVLLLDEPLSALDPQIREEMQIELARLQKQLGMTFVMVTHDQNEALALSSRIAVFCKGRVEQVGTPESVYRSPSSVFVAKFIGQTNVIEGEIIANDGYYQILVAGGLKLVSSIKGERLPSGARVAALVKPSAISFVEDSFAPALDGEVFEVEVLNKSYQGPSTEYLIGVSGTEFRLSAVNSKSDLRNASFETTSKVFISADSCDVLPL
jgi:spermidine/putrescine transport system ATP-binding protein